MAKDENKSLTPAYIPYKLFSRFINGLRETTLPNVIDKTVMPKMSGGDQSAMLVALRFLKLINADKTPTQAMTQLIEAKGEQQAPVMRNVLTAAYPFLFKGGIDLERATTGQVEQTFKAQGVTGSTINKSVLFFLNAARENGVKVSPHVTAPPVTRSAPRRTSSPRGKPGSGDGDLAMHDTPTGAHEIRLPLLGKSGGILFVAPADFTKDDWDFIKPMLENYLNRLFKEGAS